MMIQSFPGFPLLKQAEIVFVMDITENTVISAPFFHAHGFDHRKKGLRDLQMFIRKCIQCDSDNDHDGYLFNL